MCSAVKKVKEGALSLKQAAENYDVPKSTLFRYSKQNEDEKKPLGSFR